MHKAHGVNKATLQRQKHYRQFLDVMVRSRMAYQSIEVDPAWVGNDGLIDFGRLPDHLRGPVEQMRLNSEPVVNQLLDFIEPDHRQATTG